jgi:UDP-glucuronate 4-epimerase
MKVIVTGAAGFIGSHIVDALLARGDKVLALDTRPGWENLGTARLHPNYAYSDCDVRDIARLEAAIVASAEYDAIIHLAALVGVRPSIAYPVRYVDVNVLGTASILDAASRKKIPFFVFASSSSVYGDRHERVAFDESDDVSKPISPYAATKRAGELLCHSAHHTSGLSVVCLRLFSVYGPRQRPDLAIHSFVSLLEQGKPLPLFGDGQSTRDYTHVTDIVAGTLSALDFLASRKQPIYEIVNLGTARPVALRALAEILMNNFGAENAALEMLPVQSGDVQQTYASIEKAARLFGYKPKVDIAAGIADFIDWHRSVTAGRDRFDPSHAPGAARSPQASVRVEEATQSGPAA